MKRNEKKSEKNKNKIYIIPTLNMPTDLIPPNDSMPTLISSVSLSSYSTSSTSNQYAFLLERVRPIVHLLEHNTSSQIEQIKSSFDFIDTQMKENSNGSLENYIQDLGRCLGLLLMVWGDAPSEIRKEIRLIMKDIKKVDMTSASSNEVVLDLEDVLVRVKKSGEEDSGVALLELGFLIREGLVKEEESENVIMVLLTRLGNGKVGDRLKILLLLRELCDMNEEIKETMSGIESLSTIVRSLTRDIEESREAVGLLTDLSTIQKVRQRIGRIQGCIVMLVALFNGKDIRASRDARKLLIALSSNTQNVLLMAETGYFLPLVQYLKEGSDMNKILMAASISRMELTEQTSSSLQGAIEPLAKMFDSGKLESKLSSLKALSKLSRFSQNLPLLINSGIIPSLLQLLFSVTSVILTLREPASCILANLSKSPVILTYKQIAPRLLSLLNLSSPTMQLHLLNALNNIASHPNAKEAQKKMHESGAMVQVLPFVESDNNEHRSVALNLLHHLSKEFNEDLEENHLNILVHIIHTSNSEQEKTTCIWILSNLPVKSKKATETLIQANILPLLVSLLENKTSSSSLVESIASLFIRFTVPWDKKLQKLSVSHGLIPCLVKLLSNNSTVAKSNAAISLYQLSQNSTSLQNAKSWSCSLSSKSSICELHSKRCSVKTTFCLVKANAVRPLVEVLEGEARGADEAVMSALSSLMVDEVWENGSEVIEKANGVEAIVRVLGCGTLKAKEKAVWILERIFRGEKFREKYGGSAQVVLIELAVKGEESLKPMIAKILGHLQLLQMQSSYF